MTLRTREPEPGIFIPLSSHSPYFKRLTKQFYCCATSTYLASTQGKVMVHPATEV